ncbi:protein phosphatase 2C domain-containing protein [Aquibacillus kalidii]|uniref:protein phosphatase 2C domain-containing protein n=1 Tax=Aquibacillus kalidii TaxID=2762597 RepID=UPI001F237D90|nr:protein phosphatase 2C domain-containing protein [Aquibacillus kalidii]
MKKPIIEFSWNGSLINFVDDMNIKNYNQISLGRYGGNSSAGQYKNEDGCLIWLDNKQNWEFVVILDAHNSAESAALVIKQFSRYKKEIQILFSLSYEQTLKRLEATILNLFQEEQFLADCQKIKGETACITTNH